MVEHPKKWKEEIGLDPDDFPDGSREPFNVLHVSQNYKQVYQRLKDTAMAIPDFFWQEQGRASLSNSNPGSFSRIGT